MTGSPRTAGRKAEAEQPPRQAAVGAAPAEAASSCPAPAGVVEAPVSLRRILVALDQSDHAIRALREVSRLASSAGGRITGIHAYAARLHDRRFRQMEGGLPERYRRESEMEHQRDVHEDLIGMGLGLISDSYHRAARAICEDHGVPFAGLSPEGRNYARILEEADTGRHDVLAMGALGLGAVAGSAIGSVCERVVRRAAIDVFVARNRHLEIGDGPVVVGMDGSPRAFGALRTAIDIARRLGAELHVVAAYDPYYHYVAFNKISGVLDEEAGKVFRFREQEKLHEELIDDGIARIYQAHLNVAETVAEEAGMAVVSELLAGKPWQAIRKYVERHNASLLVVGKTGIHADEGLDIGSNTENLLRCVPCHVWIGTAEYRPPAEVVAEETIMWSEEAEAMIGRAPDFVRGMARTAVIRKAQAEGHTFITTRFVEEAMRQMMPGADGPAEAEKPPHRAGFAPLEWSEEALALLEGVADGAARENLRLRAEKAARRDAGHRVLAGHLRPFLEEAGEAPAPPAIRWKAAALARLQRVPEAYRAQVRRLVEDYARDHGATEIGGQIEEAAFASVRQHMCPVENGGGG
jgi:nucleotide-binding universal stress UspA family protein